MKKLLSFLRIILIFPSCIFLGGLTITGLIVLPFYIYKMFGDFWFAIFLLWYLPFIIALVGGICNWDKIDK